MKIFCIFQLHIIIIFSIFILDEITIGIIMYYIKNFTIGSIAFFYYISSAFEPEIQMDIKKAASDSMVISKSLQSPSVMNFMEQVSDLLIKALKNGNKIIVAGNGGSLSDAMHFVGELTGRFKINRAPLPAIVLNDSTYLTAVSNDYNFEDVFSRGVEAFAKKGDVLIVLSTSGNSKNILKAIKKAKSLNIKTVAFLGRGGGLCTGLCDIEFSPKEPNEVSRIQEMHMLLLHLIAGIIEKNLFKQ